MGLLPEQSATANQNRLSHHQKECRGTRCAEAVSTIRNKEAVIKQQIKRGLLVSGAVLSIGAASVGTMGLAHAATSSSTSTNPQQGLIDKLVSKFNLNKDDVQKVFDQDRSNREATRQQEIQDKIAALVKDGKLTQDQADKLIAKGKELQTQREANRDAMMNKTDAERKTAMDAQRDSFKKWLSDNGIAEEYGRLIMGHGHGGRGPGGPPPSESSNSSTSN